MVDSCCCPPEAGSAACELADGPAQSPSRAANTCPACGLQGKPVQGQTVKALLSVSLREVIGTEYFFCRTQECQVVYFSPDGEQPFRIEQLREHVYQKEPESDHVLVCSCFRYTAGEIRAASAAAHQAIVEDIRSGIDAGQCACDLRNPQGSCCLGNVVELIKRCSQDAA